MQPKINARKPENEKMQKHANVSQNIKAVKGINKASKLAYGKCIRDNK